MCLTRFSYAVFAATLSFIFFAQPVFAFQVFLDAGHGGQDQGASRGKITEAAITLKVVKRIGSDLSTHPDIHVSYTRTSNVYRSLEERVQLANRAHPDLFLSVHANSSSDPSARGQEIYFQNVLDPDQKSLFLANLENQNMHGTNNSAGATGGDVNAILADLTHSRNIHLSGLFAEKLHKDWQGDSVIRRRSIRQAPFFVISNVDAPAALIEIGYITNPTEAHLLTTNRYQEKIARGITNAIIQFKELVDNPVRPSLN